MTQYSQRYRRNAAAFAETIRGVPEDAWSAPSPCPGWTARDVVRHVVDTQGMFEKLVGREIEPGPSVDDDPLAAFEHATGQIAAHLDDLPLAAAEYEGMLGRSTFERSVDQFLSGDLAVHRWDVASATGQDTTIPDDEVERAWQDVEVYGEMLRSPGAFGPEVEPAPDADAQTRLLNFLGRRA